MYHEEACRLGRLSPFQRSMLGSKLHTSCRREWACSVPVKEALAWLIPAQPHPSSRLRPFCLKSLSPVCRATLCSTTRSLHQRRSASGEPSSHSWSRDEDRVEASRWAEADGNEQQHSAEPPGTSTSPPRPHVAAAAPLEPLSSGPGLQSALPAAHAAAVAAAVHHNPRPPTLHILRSSQLDAARLDAELASLLGEQLGRVFAFFNPVCAKVPWLHHDAIP